MAPLASFQMIPSDLGPHLKTSFTAKRRNMLHNTVTCTFGANKCGSHIRTPIITANIARQGRLDFDPPLAGNTLCVGWHDFDKAGLRLHRQLLECWRMAYALWSDWGNGAGVLFEVKPKEQPANRPITCDYSKRIALNARKALRGTSKTLGPKTEEQCRKGGFPWRKKTNTPE